MTITLAPPSPAPTTQSLSSLRTTRYSTAIPIQKLTDTRVTLIGVGGVGRNLALLLARAGVNHIQLWDPDRVEGVNLGPQGWVELDVGQYKVTACTSAMEEINRGTHADPHAKAFDPEVLTSKVVFCMVDNIETRGKIFDAIHSKLDLWVDCRTALDALQLYCWTPMMDPSKYKKTIFPKKEAVDQPCTARSTPEINAMSATLAMAAYVAWLRGRRVPDSFAFDTLSWTADPTFA